MQFGRTHILIMKKERPISLDNSPLQFAPSNELGVVFLFSHLIKKLQLRIVEIRPHFPDCIAYRRCGNKEKLIKIEFEYKSSNFILHKHNFNECDCIVCWIHDSPDIPEEIEVIELKKYFGVAFKVWIQPVIKSQYSSLEEEGDIIEWGLSKNASPGDLLLMYKCYPAKMITDIFILLEGEKERGGAGWREGNAIFGIIKRLHKLENPIFLEDFQRHRVLSRSSFVRRNMQGNLHVTEYWHYIRDIIIERNPKLDKYLIQYKSEYV